MKDLAFLLITLALITVMMMMAQDRYRSDEKKATEQWKLERYQPVAASPTPTPSPSISPTTSSPK